MGILVGFGLFLIGAQLPYREICDPLGRCIHAERLIDLTPNPGSNHDAWAVSSWLARLTPVLVAAALIYRTTAARTRAERHDPIELRDVEDLEPRRSPHGAP